MKQHNCIAVLGPTASGKTRLACLLASHLQGEIISADSRQVYRRLNIGTGKDLEEYRVNGAHIPYHLIDVAEPGTQFYLHEFMQALTVCFNDIVYRNKMPIICGGTGLYLDALRKDFSLTQIPENHTLRNELEHLDKNDLVQRLQIFPAQHVAGIDTSSKKRIIRGIEIATFLAMHPGHVKPQQLPYRPLYIGIKPDPEKRRMNISHRLTHRLNNGLIEEARDLLADGMTHEQLQRLGLEYKFLSLFLQNKITYMQLQQQLETAIFQFAKRQMTWFRKMEKEGVTIHWVEKNYNLNELLALIAKS